jgi:hypothetical protein
VIVAATHNPVMKKGEQALLKKAIGERPALLCVKSQTQVDVGLWWRWRDVWVCVCEKSVVLLADGPSPFLQSVGYDALDTTFYSHRSSELVLVPAPDLLVRSLAVAPDDGWALLSLIQKLSGQQSQGKDNIHAATSH